MTKFLLWLETVLTVPFFLLSWLLCSLFYAVRAGRDMARADTEAEKEAVLNKVFGSKEKTEKAGVENLDGYQPEPSAGPALPPPAAS